jgi:hypothetical protein
MGSLPSLEISLLNRRKMRRINRPSTGTTDFTVGSFLAFDDLSVTSACIFLSSMDSFHGDLRMRASYASIEAYFILRVTLGQTYLSVVSYHVLISPASYVAGD